MWEPRRLTTLWDSAACCRNSFTFSNKELLRFAIKIQFPLWYQALTCRLYLNYIANLAVVIHPFPPIAVTQTPYHAILFQTKLNFGWHPQFLLHCVYLPVSWIWSCHGATIESMAFWFALLCSFERMLIVWPSPNAVLHLRSPRSSYLSIVPLKLRDVNRFGIPCQYRSYLYRYLIDL
jgi:hypothetical protein